MRSTVNDQSPSTRRGTQWIVERFRALSTEVPVGGDTGSGEYQSLGSHPPKKLKRVIDEEFPSHRRIVSDKGINTKVDSKDSGVDVDVRERNSK